ncbi:MAG: DUF6056 family protein [Dysgonomonas sp.]|nr:DUF6056 family protein [Dysgonomonas sp.]
MLNFIFSASSNFKKQKNLMLVILVILLGFVFVLNYIFPTCEDDWTYAFVWDPVDIAGRKITSFSDLFDSQYAHYMLWGGRVVAHTIAQLLLCLDPIYQDILNSLVFVVLMFLLYKYANINKPVSISLFLLVGFLFWFLQPYIISSSFWITGSANYLWCGFIVFSFVYPFYSLYINENGENSYLKSILFFFAGIIAGWTNENTIIAIVFFVAGMLVLLKIRKKKIPNWAYWGFAGLIIGALFLYLAPGNMLRYNSEIEDTRGSFSLDILASRLQLIFRYYRKFIMIPSVLSIISIIYFFRKGTEYQKLKIAPLLLLLFVSAHIALFVMLGTPIFPERAMFGLIIIFIILIGIAYANANINLNNKKVQIGILGLFFAFIVGFGIDYQHKFRRVYKIYSTLKEREKIMEKGKEIGIKDYIFDNQLIISNRYHFWDLLEDPKAGKNRAYSYYYNINSVIVIDRSLDTVNQELVILKNRQDSIINAYDK